MQSVRNNGLYFFKYKIDKTLFQGIINNEIKQILKLKIIKNVVNIYN